MCQTREHRDSSTTEHQRQTYAFGKRGGEKRQSKSIRHGISPHLWPRTLHAIRRHYHVGVCHRDGALATHLLFLLEQVDASVDDEQRIVVIHRGCCDCNAVQIPARTKSTSEAGTRQQAVHEEREKEESERRKGGAKRNRHT